MSLIASVLPITVCLLYTVSLTSYPPQASAVSLPQEYDQDQMDTLISNFVQSPQSRDADQWFQLQQLKRKWNQDRLQNKRKSKQRRRNNACNPFTGKCSAGWKRSPPIQQDAADLEDRSLDFSQAPGASFFPKRVPYRQRTSGRTQTNGNYPRSLRGPKCNQLNGRCSAGWKRSPMRPNNEVPFPAENGRDLLPENIFEILDRLDEKSFEYPDNLL